MSSEASAPSIKLIVLELFAGIRVARVVINRIIPGQAVYVAVECNPSLKAFSATMWPEDAGSTTSKT
jgi:hypothetical protein